ncbi:MAG: single-stranded-DNA-specific exonuclease RecJ, partial [Lachnospiraceae bacterium]|nr:single-stranded-DNA-specific exonuclease RecJ [Lachnospiraceae bacterium]
SYVSSELIDEMDLLEPFGKGNSKPVFADKDIEILYPSLRGNSGRVLGFKLKDKNGFLYNGVYFGDAEGMLEKINENNVRSIIYYPKHDDFRGPDAFQITVDDIL